MPELKEFTLPSTAKSKPEKDNKRATLVLLIFILLGLLLVYWVLTKPPRITSAKPTRGLTTVFSIYGISRRDLLKEPNAVYVHGNGDIYVADTGNNRIAVFDSEGRYKSKITYKKILNIT